MGVYKDLEAEFDYEIVEEFLGHFSYQSENLDRLIIDLNDPDKFTNNINELFRIFHTIKSASAYLKIEPVNKVVTLAEEILEECRILEGAASEALINWLLRISAQLQAYRDDLENDHETFTPLDKAIIKVPTEYLR